MINKLHCRAAKIPHNPISTRRNGMKEDIRIEVCQAVDISLESMMGSTGYAWELTALEGCISLTGTELIPTSTRAIAPVTQVFRLRGNSVGNGKAVFSLAAPWKQEKPIKELVYLFTVVEAQLASEDNLRLEGFVASPQVTVREKEAITPYCTCGCGCLSDDCCSPQPQPKYGIKQPPQVVPVYSVPLDPCRCSPESDTCLCTPPQVMRYNIPPMMRYNFPTMRYNFPLR
jgi:hypothetical protein